MKKVLIFIGGFLLFFVSFNKLADAQSSPLASVTSGPHFNNSLTSSFQTVIDWQTDLPTSSYVAYSLTGSNFVSEDPAVWGTWRTPINNSALTTSHEVNIGGLTPYTTYYYRISGVDSQGRQPSTNPAVKTFITHGAPLITVYPTTVNIGYNQATIKWTTNYKTTSYVGYSDQNSGFTSSDPTQWGRWNYNIDKPTTQNNLDYVGNYTAMKTDHSVTIGGLSPATTYYFRVTGKDYPYVGSFSNFSDVVSFTTPEQGGTPPPPVPAPAPVITFTSGSNNPTPTIMATDPTKYTITTSFNTGSVLTVASIAYTRAEGGSWAPPTDPTVASTLRHQTPAATHSFTIGSLIPGTYTFTVYAKQPGTSDLLSNAGGSFSVTAATTAACGTSVGSVCCATSPKCTVNAATSVFLHCTGSVCSSFRSLVISPAQWFAGFNGNNLYDLNGDGRVGGKDYALWLQAGNSL